MAVEVFLQMLIIFGGFDDIPEGEDFGDIKMLVAEVPKTFKKLVKHIADKETVMLFGDDADVVAAKMCTEHGPKAAALMLASFTYFTVNGTIYTLAEGIACYREALKIATKNKSADKLVELLKEVVHDAWSYLYWTTNHYDVRDYERFNFKERQNKWPLKMDISDPNDFLSLGNMLIYTAISKTDFNSASNGERIAMESAAGYLKRIQKEIARCPKQK